MPGAIVQTKENADFSTSSSTIASGAMGTDITAGNFLWIAVNADTDITITPSINSGTATLGSITSQGSIVEAGVLDELEHFTAPITGTGSLDILITYGSATIHRAVLVAEISGVSAVDGTDEQTDSGNNPTATLTVNVSAQPAFGLSFNADYQGGPVTVGSGWTNGGTFWAGVEEARLQTKAITATGNTTANFGNTGLDRSNSVMVVFTNTVEASSGRIANQRIRARAFAPGVAR
jgi:hypothetical protein